jgi:hypothetical protein
MILPRSFSYRRILTIGRFQIKSILLECKSKIKCIIYSNRIETIDKLFYNTFPNSDWKSLPDNLLENIVSFYNGDKTGLYFKTLKYLISLN